MTTKPPPLRFNRRPVPGATAFDKTNPFIYLGSAAGVKKARARPGSLIAPIDIDPELLKWPVQGLSVLLVADEEQRISAARLAGILIRDGATLVACVSDAGPLSFHGASP
jgi:hypothetical protein